MTTSTSMSTQFEALSNSLRKLPEEIIRLAYFINKIDEPNEGIANVELAYTSVLSHIYGMMCTAKDERLVESIYSDGAITTVVCMRHALQHGSMRPRNFLRDYILERRTNNFSLVNYRRLNGPSVESSFHINIKWLQDVVAEGNNKKRLLAINDF